MVGDGAASPVCIVNECSAALRIRPVPKHGAAPWSTVTRRAEPASLGADTIAHVVDKFIIEPEGQLEDKRVILEVDEEARA